MTHAICIPRLSTSKIRTKTIMQHLCVFSFVCTRNHEISNYRYVIICNKAHQNILVTRFFKFFFFFIKI